MVSRGGGGVEGESGNPSLPPPVHRLGKSTGGSGDAKNLFASTMAVRSLRCTTFSESQRRILATLQAKTYSTLEVRGASLASFCITHALHHLGSSQHDPQGGVLYHLKCFPFAVGERDVGR